MGLYEKVYKVICHFCCFIKRILHGTGQFIKATSRREQERGELMKEHRGRWKKPNWWNLSDKVLSEEQWVTAWMLLSRHLQICGFYLRKKLLYISYHAISHQLKSVTPLFFLNLLCKLRNRNLVICYRKKIRRLIDPICLTNYHSTVAKNDVELVVFELFRFARRSYKYTFAAQL